MAAVGLMFAACSEKEDVIQEAPINQEFTDGAYIGISLQLPSADATTRANDDLSNGTADEFEVKNATLYIFKLAKTSTANPDEAATYVDKVSLGNTYDKDKEGPIADPGTWGVQSGVSATNITSTYNEATLIPNDLASKMKADTENNYYAYVIVNHNGQVPDPDGMTFGDFSGAEFDQIGADIAAKKNVWETGLLMTNAPICSVAGGENAPADGAKYSTLVPLDNTKIYGGKTQAENNPAACVYVERAAVKITVEDNRTDKKIGTYDVTINSWQVINNEPTYYNTRHINNDGSAAEDWGPYYNADFTGTTNKYRFVSLYKFNPSLPAGATHTDGFRTYFAQDVQYDKNATLANTVATDARWIDLKDADGNWNHAYTTENTFDVAHQTWQNTTMVTLKVTIGNGSNNFYTVGKGGQTMYTEANALAAIENYVKGDNDVAAAMTALRTKLSQNHTNQEVTSGLTVSITTAPSTGTTDVAFTVAPAFKIAGTAVTTYNATADADGKSEKQLYDAIVTAINSVIDADATTAGIQTADPVLLSYYAGGVSYYNVRIKHFGDVETPWSGTGSYIAGGGANVNEIYFGVANKPDGTPNTPTTAQITAGQKNFLGRYGVVRDNWYKLSIDKIGNIGTAEPVDPSTVTPDTPDDEIENFISVHVHIVPWVLRSQSVQF